MTVGGQNFYGVACPSATQCTAVDAAGSEVTFNPQSPGTHSDVAIDTFLTSVACVSVTQCTAVDGSGREVTFNPQSPGTPTPVTIDSSRANMIGVACPSATQCTAVEYSGLGGEVTFNPHSPGTPTPVTIDSGHNLMGVACPSVTQCTTVDLGSTGGRALTFNPQAPAPPAPVTVDSGAWISGVACASANACVAVDASGNVGDGNPTSASAWTLQPIDGGGSLTAVSCPVAAVCVAVNQSGDSFLGRNLSLPLPPAQVGSGPTISGTTTQGQSLTESPGSWSNSPTRYAFRWLDCDSAGNHCRPNPHAAARSYALTVRDVGHTIRVQVTAANAGGQSSPAVSAATAVVQGSNSAPRPFLGLITTSASHLTVMIGCNGSVGARCSVKLILAATETLSNGKVVGVSAKARKTKKAVVLGRASVTVAADKIKRVPIPLDNAGKRLLAKRHKLSAKLTMTAGTSTVARRVVTFRRRPRPKHHR